MNVKNYFAVFVLLLFIACGESKYAGDIKMLDSLKREVVKVQTDFSSLDSTRMMEISKEVHRDLKALEQVYLPDSIDMRIASIINYYKSFRKSGGKFNVQRLRIKNEIPYTIKQLDGLLADLNNGALKEEEAKKYIQTEKQAAIMVTQTFNFMKVEAQIAFNNYDSIKVIMTDLLDSLRNDSLNIQSIRLKKLKEKTKRGK